MSKPIDTFNEEIISVDEAAKHFSSITSKKQNKNMILRWMNRGVSGVKLRSIRIGNAIYTSKEALNEFVSESRNQKRDKHAHATKIGIARSKQAIDHEAQELGI